MSPQKSPAEKPKKREPAKVPGVYEKYPGSGVWYIRYADETGKIQRESVGAKSLAVEVRKDKVADVARRKRFPEEAPKPSKPIPTVAEAIDAYLSGPGAKKLSWRDDVNFSNLWKDQLGRKRLDEVAVEDIEAVRDSWLKTLAAQTVRNRMNFLSGIYTLANRRGTLLGNPVIAAGLPPKSLDRVRHLKPREEKALREAFSDLDHGEDFEIVELAYHTGLRRGELFGLRRENYDPERKVIGVIVGRTRKRLHEVRLNARAAEIIERRLASHDSEWVFVGPRGAPLDAHNWYNRVFLPAVRTAKIRDLHFHDLRHTTATELRRGGAKLEDVADVLGHADLQTSRRYAHILPDQKDALMDGLLKRGDALANEPVN